jgi:hypothetical protein
MTTVRRVQYGVPGGPGGDDPAAGGTKPRVVVTEDIDEAKDRFQQLLDADLPRPTEDEAAAGERRQMAKDQAAATRRSDDDDASADATANRPRPQDDARPRARDLAAQDAATRDAAAQPMEGVPELAESTRRDDGDDGPNADAELSDGDDDPSDGSTAAVDPGEAESGHSGRSRAAGGATDAQDPLARPIDAATQLGDRHRRHGDGSGLDDDEAAVAAAATLLQPQAAPAAVQQPTPTEAPAPSRDVQAVAEVARQVAAQLAVGRASGGAAAHVRIQLRDDVLPRTSLTITNDGDTVAVTVTTGSAESAAAIEANAQALAGALAVRTGHAARVRFRDASGAAQEAFADAPTADDRPGAAAS